MKPQYIQALRREAEEEARKILKDRKHFNTKTFESKNNISKKRTSSLHSLLPQETIEYCINNGLDIGYLYDEVLAKYNGSDGIKKRYYTPTGAKRGRPKKENNE